MFLSAYEISVNNSNNHVFTIVFEGKNKILISKVFTDTEVPQEILQLDNVEYGGTGFYYDKAPKLPNEIEHIFPDYHLYDNYIDEQIKNGKSKKEFKEYIDFSIGFTTRGCIRQCKFCVNQNYKSCNRHSPITEFLDQNRKYICLLDDNIFACRDWKDIFDDLIATGKPFCYKQGMDERLLTDEKCHYLFQKSKYYGNKTFAFDNIKDHAIIENKLQLIAKYTTEQCRFYTFCGFNHDSPGEYDIKFWQKDVADLFERITILMKYKHLPYIMRFKDYELSPYKGIYITAARWCNQPSFFKKKSFREFSMMRGENYAEYRYLKQFEADCPGIAQEYFDRKWE